MGLSNVEKMFEHLSIEQKAIFPSQGERFEDIFGINDDSVNAL